MSDALQSLSSENLLNDGFKITCMVYILVLDIGGTNVRLAMMETDVFGNSSLLLKKVILTEEVSSLVQEINHFLKEAAEKGFETNTCSISVAGPVEDDGSACYHPTNVEFSIVAKEIVEGTYLENVIIINDFQAIGEAVADIDLSVATGSVLQLPSLDWSYPEPVLSANRAVIGPGTGLGISYIVSSPEGFIVSPSEGGHATLSFGDDCSRLMASVRSKLGVDRLSMESLVSGGGIALMMEFFINDDKGFTEVVHESSLQGLDEQSFEKICDDVVPDEVFRKAFLEEKQHPGTHDLPKMVSENLTKNHRAYVTMRLFMHHLGIAAQAVALHGGARGGLFIAGGIPLKNKELLFNGDFMKGFTDNRKENIKSLLEKIPVYLLRDPDIGLKGCAKVARGMMGS